MKTRLDPSGGPASSRGFYCWGDYFFALTFRACFVLDRELEPYRFLKQARQRASRLFLKEGARSSLPQYLQISEPDSLLDDRLARCAVFSVLDDEALVPRTCFFSVVV